MPEQCQGTTKGGARCAAKAVAGDTLCPWHTSRPEWVAKRAAWSSEGGRQKSTANRAKRQLPTTPMSNAETHAWLTVAFAKALKGEITPALLSALCHAARTMSELGRASELEERLTTIERRLSGRVS